MSCASPWSTAIRGNVYLAPGAQKDAFDRLRTSQPVELFSAACENDSNPLQYENVTSGGTALYNSDTSSVDMTVSAAGQSVIRTSRYVRYRPGKSQLIFITGNLGGRIAGTNKKIGYYDSGDGIFFELDGTNLYAVLRSSTTGSVVNTQIAQTSWNIDPLDGTGPSGITLDLTKQQVVVIDFGWLGSAIIRWGFVLEGRIWYVHQETPSNVLGAPYMSHASLPVRWEISSTAGTSTLSATCASVQSEGGFNTLGVKRSISSGNTPIALSFGGGDVNLVPLLTVRLKSAYIRGQLIPEGFTVFAAGNADFEIRVLRNCNLVGTSYANSSEATEYDVSAANTITSGEILHSDYGAGGGGPIKSGASTSTLESDIPISSNYAGTADTITIAVRPLSGNSTDFYACLDWREFY